MRNGRMGIWRVWASANQWELGKWNAAAKTWPKVSLALAQGPPSRKVGYFRLHIQLSN